MPLTDLQLKRLKRASKLPQVDPSLIAEISSIDERIDAVEENLNKRATDHQIALRAASLIEIPVRQIAESASKMVVIPVPEKPQVVDVVGIKRDTAQYTDTAIKYIKKEFEDKINKAEKSFEKKIPQPYDEEKLLEEIQQLKDRINNLPAPRTGWGAHPLLIQDDGTTVDKVARIINFTGGTVTRSPSGVVTVPLGGGGGYQAPTSGDVDGVNDTFVWATAPNVLMIDRVPTQKVSSDGTVNWTGTTTTVLTTIPFDDLFAL